MIFRLFNTSIKFARKCNKINMRNITFQKKPIIKIMVASYGLLTIEEINKTYPLCGLVNELENYAPYLLTALNNKNENKLEVNTIAFFICNSKTFRKGFLMHLIQNNDMELYIKIIEKNRYVNGCLFEKSDEKMKIILANYLFDNLDTLKKYIPNAISDIVHVSALFRELIVKKIVSTEIKKGENKITDPTYKIDYTAWGCLLEKISDDSRKELYNYLIKNINNLPAYVIINSLQEKYNFGKYTYAEKVSAQMFANFSEGDYGLFNNMNGYAWCLLIDSKELKEKWKKFAIKNKVVLSQVNNDVLEHLNLK